MFGSKAKTQESQANARVAELEAHIKRINADHEIWTKDLKSQHARDLKDKEFEIRHFKDDELKKAEADLDDQKTKNAVLTKENEMLKKITDLNADIIDIKDLVNKLVDKLPTMNISSLSVLGK